MGRTSFENVTVVGSTAAARATTAKPTRVRRTISRLLSRDFLRRGCIVDYRTAVLAIPPRPLAIGCLRPSRCLLRRLSPRAGTQAGPAFGARAAGNSGGL